MSPERGVLPGTGVLAGTAGRVLSAAASMFPPVDSVAGAAFAATGTTGSATVAGVAVVRCSTATARAAPNAAVLAVAVDAEPAVAFVLAAPASAR
jgi:hypothetical protein